jgi:hypothetical protein
MGCINDINKQQSHLLYSKNQQCMDHIIQNIYMLPNGTVAQRSVFWINKPNDVSTTK